MVKGLNNSFLVEIFLFLLSASVQHNRKVVSTLFLIMQEFCNDEKISCGYIAARSVSPCGFWGVVPMILRSSYGDSTV